MGFSIDLTRIAERHKKRIRTVAQKITMEAFRRVILRTPVDTGRARANWGVTFGQVGASYEIEATDKDGNKTISSATKDVTGWECYGPIFLTNNLPYILVLEHGHSQQAPQGMVHLTAAEMQEWARRARL